ncbi:hypothetical protein Syun_028112 [Stephania yunnanensis]|uniref:Uncharacterized protein n=1 Tax=Stephania yunnanensis TaxID=152371 RepID=A0AAP0EGR5_9MAGN
MPQHPYSKQLKKMTRHSQFLASFDLKTLPKLLQIKIRFLHIIIDIQGSKPTKKLIEKCPFDYSKSHLKTNQNFH